jgi:hypothetical protein
MNKYLFLDIDGVLNHDEWFESDDYRHHQQNWRVSMFDPKCVERVNTILRETGAKLVVSSSWRGMCDLEEIFEGVGLPTEFDVTPHADMIYSREEHHEDSEVFWRGSEIKYYLERHAPGRYVILDDDCDMLDEQLPYFINTCGDRIYRRELYLKNDGSGLTDRCVEQAINILNNGTAERKN